MPQNKRESVVFTIMMCSFMVLIMSNYNTALILGQVSAESVQKALLGFPVAFIFAMICDLMIVSRAAKWFVFRFVVKPQDAMIKKVLSMSCAMVVPMVVIMSFYGAIEFAIFTGNWQSLGLTWRMNILKNIIVALPLQLLIAGPLVRKAFRWIYPITLVDVNQ